MKTIKKKNKIVIKIGTNVIVDKLGMLDEPILAEIVRQVSLLVRSGNEVLLVTSGAIGSGMGILGLKKKPKGLSELQALAALGQPKLVETYNKYFSVYGLCAGQILITQEDFDDRARFLNIHHTVTTLLKHGAVPIINENDTICTEEIKCGDNDRISALVADLVSADILIILSSVDGFLDENGDVIKQIGMVGDNILSLIKDTRSDMGSGGMHTKLQAADFARKAGIDCYIAGGKKKGVILDVLRGVGTFTHFCRSDKLVTAKKRWIGYGRKTKGAVIIDEGAKNALLLKQKSLLSAGVVGITGSFNTGDLVSIKDKNGKEIARGITNYASNEISRIKGIKTKDIETVLGYKSSDEVINRDDMAVL